MKTLLTVLLMFFSVSAHAGAYGEYVFACMSESRKTHVEFRLKDTDYASEAYLPNRVVISVRGNVLVLDGKQIEFEKSGPQYGSVVLNSKNGEYKFIVSFRTQEAEIVSAWNPRPNGSRLRGLEMSCQYRHDL